MRSRLAIGFVLLVLATAASLLLRAGTGAMRPLARAECPARVVSPAAQPPLESEESGSALRRPQAEVLRFEPLEPPPRELVVRLLAGETEEPVLGAEVFLLECVDYEWYRERGEDDSMLTDVEAEARARGRRIECDAQGRVHLALPARFAFLCARKGECFGAAQFCAGDAPDDTLRLVPNHLCRVRVVNQRGAPLPGIPVVIGKRGEIGWRACTGPTGEVLVPNCEWLLWDFVGDETWFAGVEEANEHPALRWFEASEALPRELEFTLPAATALHLRLQASDGTPVSLHGRVELGLVHGCGNRAAVRLGQVLRPEFPLFAGEARVPRAEPGSSIAAEVYLDGDAYFEQILRVPELGPAEVALELPENSEVLLFRAVDAQGAPLADRELHWFTFGTQGVEASLRTDAQGRAALVFERPAATAEDEEDEEEPFRCQGVLRFEGGADVLESPAIDLAALRRAAVLDLGVLRLAAAVPLVRGRVVDASGAPLAFVGLEIEHTEGERLAGVGETKTGADGRFAIHGVSPRGRLRLLVDGESYVLPEGASPPEFESDASPELEIVLVPTGILRMSVLADARLDTSYSWILSGADGEKRVNLYPTQGPGELESAFWWLRPGLYRLRLVDGYPLDPPLAEFEDVLVQPGACTLDPRLLRVPLHVPAPQPGEPAGAAERRPIRLRLSDEQGCALERGLLIASGGCGWSRREFHHGLVELRGEQAGDTIGLWAPGRSFWEGKCPERDETLVLAPALCVRVHLELPKDLRGEFVLLDVLGHDEDSALRWLPDMAPTEFDERGEVLLECPGPGRLELGLRSGQIRLETAEPLAVVVAAGPPEQRCELKLSTQEWAAFRAALRAAR